MDNNSGSERPGKTPADGMRRLAENMLVWAFADLLNVRPFVGGRARGRLAEGWEARRQDAALWFASDGHIPWAIMAGRDPDEVKDAAIMIAERIAVNEH